MSTIDQAIAQMRADGMPELPPGHPVLDGKIHRYGPKRRGDSAWYKLGELLTRGGQLIIVGSYGDWRQGRDSFRRIEIDWKEVSREDRQEAERRLREAEEADRRRREELADKAATRARLRWKGAYTLEQARERALGLPYCERKGVDPETCRVMLDGTILVPMMLYDEGTGSRLVGVQYIMADGQKRYTKHATRVGACSRLGDPPQDGDVILMCEGWATGLSIRMATRRVLPVFVAFDTSGLLPAAEILRARYPDSPIVFCADDDWKTEVPKGTPFNAGVVYATRAAHAIGRAWVIRPLFREADRQDKWTDFNDVHAAYGLDEVSRQLDIARLIENEPPMGESQPAGAKIAQRDGNPLTEGDIPAGDGGRDDVAGGGDDGPPGDDSPLAQPDGPNGPPDNDSWRRRLQRTEKGKPKASVFNASLVLDNHPDWQGVLAYDVFAETVVKRKPPPWEGGVEGEWTELDDVRLLLWLSPRIGELGPDNLNRAVIASAHRCEVNPLREHLERAFEAWDQTPRLRMWLFDYLGVGVADLQEQLALAERSPRKDPEAIASLRAEIDRTLHYVEMVGVKWMVAAVARVFEPGCRVDNMLILEGGQGVKKSTTLEILGGEWYTDAALDFANKDSLLILQGRWIVEMAELEGMNKAETSQTKKFLTQHTDLFRPPYGRKLAKYPRRCVFAGTVNLDAYLKDDSGNRRFWPVRVGEEIRADDLRRDVMQLWGEAVHLYREKVPWWVQASERHYFAEQQEQRFAVDAWEDTILDYVNGKGEFGAEMATSRVYAADILGKALKLDKARWDRQAMLRVVGVLRRHGWIRKREPGGSRQWYYARPEPAIKVSGGREEVPDEAF